MENIEHRSREESRWRLQTLHNREAGDHRASNQRAITQRKQHSKMPTFCKGLPC